jgi:hypothetical protein
MVWNDFSEVYANLGWPGMTWDEPGGGGGGSKIAKIAGIAKIEDWKAVRCAAYVDTEIHPDPQAVCLPRWISSPRASQGKNSSSLPW